MNPQVLIRLLRLLGQQGKPLKGNARLRDAVRRAKATKMESRGPRTQSRARELEKPTAEVKATKRDLGSGEGKGWDARREASERAKGAARVEEIKKKQPDQVTPEDKAFLEEWKKGGWERRQEAWGQAYAEGVRDRRRVQRGQEKESLWSDGGYGFTKPGRGYLYQLGRRPVSAGLGTALTGMAGAQMVGVPLARGWAEDMGITEPREATLRRFYAENAGAGAGVEMRRRRLEQQMAENMARLAQVDPQAYTELAAGRELPQGARVFGGRPRMDILEQVAGRISQGGYPM